MPFFLFGGFAIFCFAFLALGALVFLACIALPPLRRFALSAALWCAVSGPCLLAWMVVATLFGFAANLSWPHLANGPIHPGDWHRGIALLLNGLALISTAAFASAAAWLHQIVIRRMTFALFRLYTTVVSAGIGSVYGWALALALAACDLPYRLPALALAMAFFLAAFGFLGFRLARQLRGKAPHRLTWVTPEEFNGTPA